MSDGCPHCRRYRERMEELEEALRQRCDARFGWLRLAHAFKLEPAQARILERLCATQAAHKDALLIASYEGRCESDWPESAEKVLSVQVARLRARLREHGVTLPPPIGGVYMLSDAAKAAIAACAAPSAFVPRPKRWPRPSPDPAIVAARAALRARLDRAVALVASGKSFGQAALLLKLTRGQVSSAVRRAKARDRAKRAALDGGNQTAYPNP